MNFSLVKKWLRQALISRGLYVYRTLPYGIDLKQDIERCGGEIECVFDVGANIGQSAKRFKGYWPDARVFCFEPISTTFQNLVQNTTDLPKVSCYKSALGAHEGKERVWIKEESGRNSLNKRVNLPENGTGKIEVVEMVTLDQFCRANGITRIDLLKLDVEGYEMDVLKGGQKMLASRSIRFIYTETTFHPDNAQHTHIGQLTEYLEPFSYRCLGIYDKRLVFGRPGVPEYCRSCDALFKLVEISG